MSTICRRQRPIFCRSGHLRHKWPLIPFISAACFIQLAGLWEIAGGVVIIGAVVFSQLQNTRSGQQRFIQSNEKGRA